MVWCGKVRHWFEKESHWSPTSMAMEGVQETSLEMAARVWATVVQS